MSESQIIAGIEQRVQSTKTRDYSIWTVGITDDPDRRASEHKQDGHNTEHFLYWDAYTEASARRIEKYFLSKGMKGDTGGERIHTSFTSSSFQFSIRRLCFVPSSL